jgi:23S rRNA (uracil1939-C5)-methyltransferase
MEELVKGSIESLAFGGQGILRHAGLVIFVPFTAPGDRISCRITKQKSTFAEAELVAIDQPSSQRVEPRCPYFGRCGGCQLQHLDEASQLHYKGQVVEDALKRIGKLEMESIPPAIAAKERWDYRRHVMLTLRQEGTGFALGYIATDNRSLVKVESCPIFIPESEPILSQLAAFCRELQSEKGNQGRVTVLKQGQGRYLLHFHFKLSPKNLIERGERALAEWKSWTGMVVSTPHGRKSLGETSCRMEIDGLEFSFSSDAFIQNHPEQSLNIYRHLVGLAAQAKADHILDLYCGIGCTSLLLARQTIRVVGIESNREAVRLAKENSRTNRVKNVSFHCADVKDLLSEQMDTLRPDFVLVNPPRIGLDPAVVNGLIAGQPDHIAYISCMPSTLARDLRLLVSAGYKLVSCQAFDMFPQTAHVETVVLLKSGFVS